MSAATFPILLVEDELAYAELFTEVFKETLPTVHIHHTVNGRAALEYLEQTGPGGLYLRPRLIVLDLNMPVINGHQFLERAKLHPDLRTMPVLVLSTSEYPGDIRQLYRLYASGSVVKPSNYDELQALVNAIGDYWQGTVKFPTIAKLSQ